MKNLPLDLPYHKGHHSIISKLIQEPAIESNITVIFGNLFNLRLGISSGSQIKLIALIGKLGYSGIVHRIKFPDGAFHLQRLQKLSVIPKALLLAFPKGICLIHVISLFIILRKADHLKITVFIQNFYKSVWCRVFPFCHFRHSHLWHLLPDDFPFPWIVVHKYKRIQADIKLGGDF